MTILNSLYKPKISQKIPFKNNEKSPNILLKNPEREFKYFTKNPKRSN